MGCRRGTETCSALGRWAATLVCYVLALKLGGAAEKSDILSGQQRRQLQEAVATYCERMSSEARNLQYSIPTRKWVMYSDLRTWPKTRDFAAHVPGWKSINGSVSSFLDERSYLQSYSSAHYGLTRLKGGWDCMRHYEIIIAGCVPYFIGLSDMPSRTMMRFPKAIVHELMGLPGVPSQEEVHMALVGGRDLPRIDHAIFPQERYEKLRQLLLEHAARHLLSQHVVADLHVNPMGVLVHSNTNMKSPEDYLRDMMIIGLVERGVRVHVTFDVGYLFEGYSKELLSRLYGRGFTYGWSLPRESQSMVTIFDEHAVPKHTWPQITYIKTTKGNLGFPAVNLLDRNADIFVDGNDITAPHPEPPLPTAAAVLLPHKAQWFRRELYDCHSQIPASQNVFYMLDSEALWACQDLVPGQSSALCPGHYRAAQMWFFAVQGLQSMIASQQMISKRLKDYYAETAIMLENVHKVIKTFLAVLESRHQYVGDFEAVTTLTWHIAREGMESFRHFALGDKTRKTNILVDHKFEDECLLFASRYCAQTPSIDLPSRDGHPGGRIARFWKVPSREACSNICADFLICTHYSYTKRNTGDCLLYDVCPAGKCYGSEACTADTLTYSMAPCDIE